MGGTNYASKESSEKDNSEKSTSEKDNEEVRQLSVCVRHCRRRPICYFLSQNPIPTFSFVKPNPIPT
jgi:hypothetical protein